MRWTFLDRVTCSAWRLAIGALLLLTVGCGGSSEPAPVASSTQTAPATVAGAASVDVGGGAGYGEDPAGDSGGGGGYGEEEMPGDSGGGAGYGEEEMGYDPGMEDDMGGAGFEEEGMEDPAFAEMAGGGSGYGARRQSPGSLQFLGGLTGPIAGKLTQAMADPEAAGPKSLIDQSAMAFSAGNEALAEQLLYAHITADPRDAGDQLRAAAFSTALRRPVWTVRWGVSYHLRADSALTDPHPVVDNMPSPLGKQQGRRGGRGGGGDYGASESDFSGSEADYEASGEPGMGAGAGAAPVGATGGAEATEATLRHNLGLISEVAGQMFDARFRDGAFGSVFPGMTPAVPASTGSPSRSGYGGQGLPGEPMPGEEMMASEEERMASENMMASEEERMASENMMASEEERMASEDMMGSEEMMMDQGMQPGGGYGQGRGQAVAAPAQPSVPAPRLPRWRPGIVFVGQGSSAEMLEQARSNGIDVLLHFDITAAQLSSDSFENVTRGRILLVADGSTVVASKAIDIREIYNRVSAPQRSGRAGVQGNNPRQKEGPTERQLVTEALEKMFQAVDEKLRVAPLPALTPQMVTGRVGVLLASASASDLRTLSELRLYESMRLLEPADLQTAMHLAAGDRGLIFLYGLPSQRREAALAMVDEALAR